MDYFDVVKGRRMCRNFKPDPIPKGAIEQILDAARHAPSGANSQPWEFVVITKQKTKDNGRNRVSLSSLDHSIRFHG